jgi:superfamily II DNA or RNA helicase
VPYTPEDVARTFDSRTIQRARGIVLGGQVTVDTSGGRIRGHVVETGQGFQVTLTPIERNRRVRFERLCACGQGACIHMAAAALAVLDTRPEWRRPVQASLFDEGARSQPARPEPVPTLPVAMPSTSFIRWRIEPGRNDIAFQVGAFQSAGAPIAPGAILSAEPKAADDTDRRIARLLGGGDTIRAPVARSQPELIEKLLRSLLATGRVSGPDGRAIAAGPALVLRAFRDPETRKLRPTGLPEGGLLLKGLAHWCLDLRAGTLHPVTLQVVDRPRSIPPTPVPPPVPAFPTAGPRLGSETAVIISRSPRVIARLGRVASPAEGPIEVLHLAFDYGDRDEPVEIDPDDQRQFARLPGDDGDAQFVRRDKAAEQAALKRLSGLGFALLRLEPPRGSLNARGVRVHRLAGRDAGERWADFLNTQRRILESEGWTIEIGEDFGPKLIEPDGEIAVAVADAGEGWFDLEVGVEIDGERRPLLPILASLIDRGGMAAVRVVDGRAHLGLEDGSVLVLPADRVSRLFSVLEAMLARGRKFDDGLRMPLAEADGLLDIDDLIARRAGRTQEIDAFLRRIREAEEIPERPAPPSFNGELRGYQRVGLGWLQRLREGGVAGLLADDMGLGKTAQTLAHIAVEREEGRLTDPCLIVVPTSLVPNWVKEIRRFLPGIEPLVLHGLDRHERRADLAAAEIVVTTYGVVARDIDLMAGCAWHLVVLDEAQAIKNPDSKATRAVCRLRANHRLCLSGTPVENNLGELWSQFAFLMPGLLGDRKEFQKHFRIPIEKRGDAARATLLMRRTRPFLLRRMKTEVARDLPPKTEVIRHIDLGEAQRDLYETIRLSVHEAVRAAIAASGLARSAITVIDALLKLRQACCDPRLVKIPAAASVGASAKLETLIAMIAEMVPEGRRILVFSQFTSMLDLIKPALDEIGVPWLELTGKTLDRATPVERFQRCEVPVFLISLKAGGRGLNLTAADTVIHYDPWWNPAAEDQATDRAYRIGQDKPVFVYKLIAADTVEERIVELQRRKENLAAATIEGAGLVSALDDGDVDYLFGQSHSA